MSSLTKIKELRAKLESLQAEHDSVIEKAKVDYTDELHKENVRLVDEMSSIKSEIAELKKVPEVGKYANHHLWTDIEPYEIVRVVSEQTLEIRPMKAELNPEWKPEFHIGGFSANCSNQNEQEYFYESDLDAPTKRIRMTKSGIWKNGSSKFFISDNPVKFHDYNF